MKRYAIYFHCLLIMKVCLQYPFYTLEEFADSEYTLEFKEGTFMHDALAHLNHSVLRKIYENVMRTS